VSVNEDDITYHFKSAKTAEAFRELNQPPIAAAPTAKPLAAADDMDKIRNLDFTKK
jgi:hypothetical protein